MSIRKDYKPLLVFGIIVTIIIVAAALFFYPNKVTVFAILIGVIMGIIVSYFLNMIFTLEDEPLDLGPGEEVIIETSDNKTYLHIPKMVGKFDGEGSPMNVTLYLTSHRIIADPLDYEDFIEEGGPYFFFINHEDIISFNHEKRGMADYLRIRFTNLNQQESDALLFTSKDTPEWITQLNKILSQR